MPMCVSFLDPQLNTQKVDLAYVWVGNIFEAYPDASAIYTSYP